MVACIKAPYETQDRILPIREALVFTTFTVSVELTKQILRNLSVNRLLLPVDFDTAIEGECGAIFSFCCWIGRAKVLYLN